MSKCMYFQPSDIIKGQDMQKLKMRPCKMRADPLHWDFHCRGSSADLNHSNIFVDMNSAPKK
jgi:uncharacterized Zn-finger protein